MKNVEHIGIAVKSLKEAGLVYETLLGCKSYKVETIKSEHVITEFFKIGETKIELMEASSDESAIAAFILKRGEGIHHIAFAVENIYEEMKRLKEEGFHILNDTPKKGADNKLVCFVHPKSAHGVLIELCQEIS